MVYGCVSWFSDRPVKGRFIERKIEAWDILRLLHKKPRKDKFGDDGVMFFFSYWDSMDERAGNEFGTVYGHLGT